MEKDKEKLNIEDDKDLVELLYHHFITSEHVLIDPLDSVPDLDIKRRDELRAKREAVVARLKHLYNKNKKDSEKK